MNKGFTSKELAFALFIIALIGGICMVILSRTKNSTDKLELLNQTNYYINRLNSDIILAKTNNETILYQTHLPSKKGETVTFKIENIRLDKNDIYKGIIKVTYNGKNEYKYRIAIHDGNYMIGTQDKLVDFDSLNENSISDFDYKLFYN